MRGSLSGARRELTRAWIVAITSAGTEAYKHSMAAKSQMFEKIFGALDTSSAPLARPEQPAAAH